MDVEGVKGRRERCRSEGKKLNESGKERERERGKVRGIWERRKWDGFGELSQV